MSRAQLLIVDDNEVDREHIQRLLGARYQCAEASTAAEALSAVTALAPECVLLDYRLPDRDGLEALAALAARAPVVMLTGQGDETIAVEAMKRGAQDYLVKGRLEAAALTRAVDNAIEKSSLRRKVEAQQRELSERVEELNRRSRELEAANRALAERQEKLDILMRRLPAMVWTTDLELRHTSVSRTGGAGKERDVAHLLDDEAAREQLRACYQAALSGHSAPFEVKVGARWFEGHVEPLRDAQNALVGTIGVCLDVSDNRSLQSQLLHAQKMDAVGQLAGGVAHDFNNILTAVLSFGRFVLEDLGPEHPCRSDVQEIIRSGERAAALTRQLLAFSRKQLYQPQPVKVDEVIAGMEKMLHRILGEDVALASALGAGDAQVHADRGHLEQVVLNLAVNARDAMPRGGKLTIETAHVDLDESYVRGHLQARPGAYVMVAVTDTGVGIPDEIRERIFEPFFSTKGPGKGTGLGLATVYGIVKQAGGDILVYSALGRGTTFKVYLPRLDPADAAARPGQEARRSASGHEHILVVEDEPAVRAVVRRALGAAGYQVTEAASPSAALAELEKRAHVDLVLTDVVMPEMNGAELVDKLRGRGHASRVLFMSGYTGGALVHQGLFGAGTPYLQKPFTPEQLAEKVREVLDAPAQTWRKQA